MKGAPVEWARAAVAAGIRHKADAIVAEVNNGGDLVTSTIRAVDPRANVRAVRASRGKVTRAEPVSALAERGLIHHVGEFRHLEDQLTQWDPVHSRKSPDRLDALVWAIHDLALSDKRAGPLRAYM
jgi:phage terminase large subunit-like protein